MTFSKPKKRYYQEKVDIYISSGNVLNKCDIRFLKKMTIFDSKISQAEQLRLFYKNQIQHFQEGARVYVLVKFQRNVKESF